MSPWLWQRPPPPSVPSTIARPALSLAQASSLSSGGSSYSRRVSRTANCHSVMAKEAKRASGLLHIGHHTLPLTHSSAFTIPYITIPPVPQIGVMAVVMVLQVAVSMGGGGYVVLLFHPGMPSKCFGTASTVMTLAHFHFHQTRKCRRMKGLSLNSQLLG